MNLQRIKDKLTYHNLLSRICDSIESDAEALIKKQKPDLSEEEVSSFVSSLSSFKKPKHKKLATHWFLKNTITLPEDHEVVEKAIKFAENKKLDPMSFKDPRELSEQLLDKNINLDKIPQFTNKKVLKKYNLTIYDVEDSKEGQQAVRDVINAQYGVNRNPWCIIETENGVLDKISYDEWNRYDYIQKRIALLNGKVIAFSANDSPIESWWDMEDKKHDGIPLPPKKEGDATTITEKITYEGLIIETRKVYAPGKFESQSYWPNGNLKESNLIYTEGTHKQWYEDGQPKSSINYKNGERDGLYQDWYDNGQPCMVCNYKDGERDGKYLGWYRDGQPEMSGTYEDGQLQGSYKEWHENGQLKKLYKYENGKRDKCLTWHENGQLQSSFLYENGRYQGLRKEWYKNGQLQSLYNYKDGKYHGSVKHWYENGQLENSWNFKNNKRHGLFQEWYEDGQLKSSYTCKDGKEHGKYQSWYENGQLKKETTYIEGEPQD